AGRPSIALGPDAASALGELSGEDSIGAMPGLQRAALEAGGERPRITRRLIEAQVSRDHDANRFHLTDAIFDRQPARALTILRNLDAAGGTRYPLLGLIGGQLRPLLSLRRPPD